ncbi:MAG: flavin reductase family protein [Candidatus Helarchaeota archaeon]|nr:flavin reductase family protein [Candidatus Helarchaeota archaeon]
MKKVKIDPFQLANITVSKTALLVTQSKEGKANIMALDWKTIGNLWGDPVCVIAVAPSRYSFSLLEEVKEFSLNVPSPKIQSAVSIAGSYSGRSTDKISMAGLTMEPAKIIDVPIIAEAMINYECKIIHEAESGSICSHRLFFGEILEAYADESLLK